MGWLDNLKAKLTGKQVEEAAPAKKPKMDSRLRGNDRTPDKSETDVIASATKQSSKAPVTKAKSTQSTKAPTKPKMDSRLRGNDKIPDEAETDVIASVPLAPHSMRGKQSSKAPTESAQSTKPKMDSRVRGNDRTPEELDEPVQVTSTEPAEEKSSLSQKLSNLFASRKAFDDGFWDDLTDTLILADFGAQAAMDIINTLKEAQKKQHLVKPEDVKSLLTELIAGKFYGQVDYLAESPLVLIFVGVNGAGKTTTIGKLAHRAKAQGRKVLLGAADTYRAAAIEQVEVWASRAGVDIETATRGEDSAAVAYRTLERGHADNYDLIMIDTAGRLHTSEDLMRELAKVIKVVRNKSLEIKMDNVHCVLVVDGNSGQNALAQAEQFNKSLDLDAVVITKLDGSPKGGSAVQISALNELPIWLIGIGEKLDDFLDFDAQAYAEALLD